MRVLLISGYHGGSHQAWAEGYKKHSAYEVELLTLPARFWKWRMHGGAVTLARMFKERLATGRLVVPDLLLFTDMIDVTTFLALVRDTCPRLPVVLYMHENQLTYPLPDTTDAGPMRRQKGERDLHYAFVNYASMLAADRVYFNSEYHRRELLNALPAYLRHFPEFNELSSLVGLEAKSGVLPPAVDGSYLDRRQLEPLPDRPPMIIWNQRWEFDKAPGAFFGALAELDRRGLDFDLAVCGESFSRQPVEFMEAKERFKERVIHWGYAQRHDYTRLLWQATITASTALHEFFGISILEALYCQTFAVLPRRLSYPELLPPEFHDHCLYDDPHQLVEQLTWSILHVRQANELGRLLARAAAEYDWRLIAPRYDAELVGIA